MLQRDAFIEQITEKLETDKNIYFLSADFGAAALAFVCLSILSFSALSCFCLSSNVVIINLLENILI